MNAKKKTLLLTAASMIAASVVATMAFAFNSDIIGARGIGEVVNGTITWTVAGSEKVKEANNKISWVRTTANGTSIVLYSFGQYNPTNAKLFDSKFSSANNYGLFIKSETGSSGSMFRFQSITSITIVSFDSQEGAQYGIYTDETASGAAVVTQTLASKSASQEESYTFTTQVEGAHYLSIKPLSSAYYFAVKSVTVTYSCEPGLAN